MLDGPFDMNSNRGNGLCCDDILRQHLVGFRVERGNVQTNPIRSKEVLNVEPLVGHNTVTELQQRQQAALDNNVPIRDRSLK